MSFNQRNNNGHNGSTGGTGAATMTTTENAGAATTTSTLPIWETEGDFFALGKLNGHFPCFILRQSEMKTLNGYIAIPTSHPLWGLHYDEMPIDCHVGFTYSGDKEDWIKHSFIPTDEQRQLCKELLNDDDYSIIGFDCAQMNDFVPSFQNDPTYHSRCHEERPVYRTKEYVESKLIEATEALLVYATEARSRNVYQQQRFW